MEGESPIDFPGKSCHNRARGVGGYGWIRWFCARGGMTLRKVDRTAPRTRSTKLAPAERMSAEEIARQAQLFADRKLLGVLPNVMPCILLAVNEHRQIVFANERFLELLSPEQRQAGVLGQRPGEVLGCVHAFEQQDGCGTAESCGLCGATHALRTGLAGNAEVQECRMWRANGEALDLRIWTTPLALDSDAVYDLRGPGHQPREAPAGTRAHLPARHRQRGLRPEVVHRIAGKRQPPPKAGNSTTPSVN